MKEIDLHGLKFVDGIEKIIKEIRKFWISNDTEIKIIHGYHGSIYKDYIGSEKFLMEMEDEGYPIKRIRTLDGQKNLGVSYFSLDIAPPILLKRTNNTNLFQKELKNKAKIKKNRGQKLTIHEFRAIYGN